MTYHSPVAAAGFHRDTQDFFRGRRVLVFGGSGFVGSHLVEQLLALSAKPIVFTRMQSPPYLASLGPEIEFFRGDLRDPAAIQDAMSRASVVLHLAAVVAGIERNTKQPATIFMDNLDIFFHMLRAAARQGIERLLITSSACVYPRHCSIPTPEEEGFQDEPELTNRGYGWAKRMEEMLGQAAAQEFGLSIATARPYNCYGPRDNFDPATSHVLPALIRKAAETRDDTFEVWGDGSHSRSFVYVDDAARGLLEVAARYPKADPLNIGTPEETTIREAADLIARYVSERRGRKIQPKFVAAGLTGQPRRCCDTSKAERILGFRAHTLIKEGLRRTIDWYLSDESRPVYSHAQ